jgi:hypothetical protein
VFMFASAFGFTFDTESPCASGRPLRFVSEQRQHTNMTTMSFGCMYVYMTTRGSGSMRTRLGIALKSRNRTLFNKPRCHNLLPFVLRISRYGIRPARSLPILARISPRRQPSALLPRQRPPRTAHRSRAGFVGGLGRWQQQRQSKCIQQRCGHAITSSCVCDPVAHAAAGCLVVVVACGVAARKCD